MDPIINQYNFFHFIKLTDEGYMEIRMEEYFPPKEDGLDQYQTFKKLGLDDDNRLKTTDDGA